MAVANLVVRIVGDVGQLSGGLGQAEGRLQAFGSKMRGIGAAMTAGLTAPIVAFGAKAVGAFQDAQATAAATEAVVRSTGAAAGFTAGEFAKMAESLSRATAFEDETIQKSQNLLATFTNIKGDNFKAAELAILDMATAMNKGSSVGADLESTTIQIGKALNDPIKGLTALSRVGVRFTEQQKDQIEALVESGDVMGAQKLILKELQTEFGGAAKAFAGTDAGKQAQAMNELGNAMEQIGAVIAPVVAQVASFASKLASFFQGLSPSAQKVVTIVLALVAVLGPLLVILGSLAGAIAAISAPVLIVVAAIAAFIAIGLLVMKHWDTIKAALVATWNFIKAAAVAVFNFLKELFLNFTPLGQIIQHWTTIRSFLVGAWNAIRGAASAIWNGIRAVIQAVTSAIRSVVTSGFNAVKSVVIGVWNAILSATRRVWNTIVSIVRGAISRITSLVNGVRRAISWILPGSPVPLVVGAEASAAAVERLARAFRGLPLDAAGFDGSLRPGYAAVGRSGSGVSVVVNVQGSVVTERDLVASIQRGLIRVGTRNATVQINR